MNMLLMLLVVGFLNYADCEMCNQSGLYNGGEITPPTNLVYQVPSDYPSDEFSCMWLVTAEIGQRVYAKINSFTSGNANAGLTFSPGLLGEEFLVYPVDTTSMLDVVTPQYYNDLAILLHADAPYNGVALDISLSTMPYYTDIQTCGIYELQVLPDELICNDVVDCHDGADESADRCP